MGQCHFLFIFFATQEIFFAVYKRGRWDEVELLQKQPFIMQITWN